MLHAIRKRGCIGNCRGRRRRGQQRSHGRSGGVGGVGSGGTSGGTGGTESCRPPRSSFRPVLASSSRIQTTRAAVPFVCRILTPGLRKTLAVRTARSVQAQRPLVSRPPRLVPLGPSWSLRKTWWTGCMPVDGGTSDAGKPDTPVICNVMCPMIACTPTDTCRLPSPAVVPAAPRPLTPAWRRMPARAHRCSIVPQVLPVRRERAPGPGPFTLSCNSVTCPAHLCVQDSNCTAGTNGRCLTRNLGGLALCSYDECFSDADCPANIPCKCRDSASSSAPNYCLAGSDCRVDSDCGPGNFCSPSPAWLDAPYYCHTASDTCMDDSDCMPLKSCAFDEQNGYWSCVVLPPPPT